MSEQLHLQEVQRQCSAAGPAAGEEAVGHRADVQQVGHAHRHHLAELPVQRVRPPETKLGTTAGGAGEPGEEGGGREEHLPEMTSSVHLNASPDSPRLDVTRINTPVPACFVSRWCRSCTGTEPERCRTDRRPRPRSPGRRASNAPAPSETATGELRHCHAKLRSLNQIHLIYQSTDQINL